MAAFRPVPEPHPNPVPRKGAGRKPKDQRFWPPQDASEDLRTRYLDLQQADENVNKADKKLAKNNDPSKTMHFQAMLLRNMTTRDKLWTECQRLEQGMAAVELSVEEAGSQAQKSHQSWTEMCDRLTARETSLKAENPFAVNEDGSIDLKLLGKESSGLQTMRNWRQHHWKELKDSFTALWNAMEVRYGADQDSSILRLQYVHALGCYPGFAQWLWPDDSQEAVYCRQQYSDPDPSTWYPVQPVQPAQDEMQHHEQEQPENGQQPEQAQGYEAPVAEQMQDWEAIPDVPLDPLNFQWYDPEAYALIQAFAQDNPVQQLQEEAVPVDVEMQDFQEITAAEYQAQRELSLQNQQPGDVQEQMAIDDWETDLTAHQHNADLDAEIESAFGILRQDQLTQQLQAQEAPVDDEIARVHEIAHPEPPAAQQESDPVHEKEVSPWFMGEQQAEAPEVESKDDEDVEMPDEEELDEEDGVEFENVTWQGVPLRELIERYEE
ncbi:hypothetical protein UCDDA912_g08136 [Diaporthe ampelina]|uniref:Uncharacterized protein n=1 Tax=Diaporthe ampelina TaxID=1214573 RepID=A0A0G2FB35_9PEZI|nr:hypothetical protein UCDDA912_g08136 [Diaporthe ampelina]